MVEGRRGTNGPKARPVPPATKPTLRHMSFWVPTLDLYPAVTRDHDRYPTTSSVRYCGVMHGWSLESRADCLHLDANIAVRMGPRSRWWSHAGQASRRSSITSLSHRRQYMGRSTLGVFNNLPLIPISEPTRLLSSSYAVFCLKKKTPTILLSISYHFFSLQHTQMFDS